MSLTFCHRHIHIVCVLSNASAKRTVFDDASFCRIVDDDCVSQNRVQRNHISLFIWDYKVMQWTHVVFVGDPVCIWGRTTTAAAQDQFGPITTWIVRATKCHYLNVYEVPRACLTAITVQTCQSSVTRVSANNRNYVSLLIMSCLIRVLSVRFRNTLDTLWTLTSLLDCYIKSFTDAAVYR